MRRMLARIRDIWCDITDKCDRPETEHPAMPILIEHERAAITSMERMRSERRQIDAAIRDGGIDYRELNRALFGRDPWPRDRVQHD